MGRNGDRDPGYAESIVDALGDGAYVLDADRNRVFANERLREVTSFGEAVLHDKHPERLVDEGYWSEETGDRFRAAVERVLAGESADERVELTTTLGDGSTVTTETRLTPLAVGGSASGGTALDGSASGGTALDGTESGGTESDDAEVRGVIGVIRDVSERVERERELERLNERLERLAGFLSHDLRNPLSVAKGYLDLARETGDVGRIDPAQDALDRIEALIDDALVMARDPDAIEIDGEAIDLRELATDCWESGDFGDPPAGASLVVEDAGPVWGDRDLLRRAVGNLIGNALDHAGEGPRVRVGVDDDGIYVADDGPGLSADGRGEVVGFGVSNDGGTGIGLAIVERVAAAHGWTLELGESPSGGFEARLAGAEPTG